MHIGSGTQLPQYAAAVLIDVSKQQLVEDAIRAIRKERGLAPDEYDSFHLYQEVMGAGLETEEAHLNFERCRGRFPPSIEDFCKTTLERAQQRPN